MPRLLDRQSFKVGQYLFKTGDEPNSVYLIESGLVDVVSEEGSEELILRTLEAGQLVGEMALIDDHPRSASARAHSPVTCILLPRSDIEGRIKKCDPLIRALLKMLVERLRRSRMAPKSS